MRYFRKTTKKIMNFREITPFLFIRCVYYESKNDFYKIHMEIKINISDIILVFDRSPTRKMLRS